VIDTEETLLAGIGSIWVSADFVAMFLITPVAASRTVMCSVAVPATASEPTVQSPPAGSYEPCEAVELT
jgi:hypothetical protein